MHKINSTLEAMGVTPAPPPIKQYAAKRIEPDGVPSASKQHQLRSTKVAGESKAARRLRRLALVL